MTTGAVDCAACRRDLLDHHRGRLDEDRAAAVAAHLERCEACAQEDVAERALTEVLECELPQYPASLALKRRLASQWQPVPAADARPEGPAPGWTRARRTAAAVAAMAILVAGGLVAWRQLAAWRGDTLVQRMVVEAVNDHLRVVARPLEVTDPGIHHVRPWFTGRLDFAPVIGFAGDEEFPLRGGGVEYFLDRRAAVLVYARRRHTISLIVVRADGLPWPAGEGAGRGRPAVRTAAERGFNVVLWRAGDLGYALVSDVSGPELLRLAGRFGDGPDASPPGARR
jgi:anti-sigma factor RsiW